MGFQSTFNQLLATAAGGIAAGKHLSQQKQANEVTAFNQAEHIQNQMIAYEDEVNDIGDKISGIHDELVSNRDKTNDLIGRYENFTKGKDLNNLTKGQKAYLTRLDKEAQGYETAYDRLTEEQAKVEKRQATVKERILLLQARTKSAPKRTKEILEQVYGGKK